jgi:preprotein translocase subunit SecA
MAEDGIEPDVIEERITALADAQMEAKTSGENATIWRQVEKSVLLERLDYYWKEHLATLDALRQVVFLRAYAQKQPINEYKQEAFGLFERMLDTIREDVTRILSTSDLQMSQPQELPELPDFLTGHFEPLSEQELGGQGFSASPVATASTTFASAAPTAITAAAGDDPYAGMGLSRNAACPCGSGKKYKHCHGAVA